MPPPLREIRKKNEKLPEEMGFFVCIEHFGKTAAYRRVYISAEARTYVASLGMCVSECYIGMLFSSKRACGTRVYVEYVMWDGVERSCRSGVGAGMGIQC